MSPRLRAFVFLPLLQPYGASPTLDDGRRPCGFELSSGGTVYLLRLVTERHTRGSKSTCQNVQKHSAALSLSSRAAALMARYVKPTRPEPTSEESLALLILLGPLAYLARWNGRRLRALACGWATWPPHEHPTRAGLYAEPRNAPKLLEASSSWSQAPSGPAASSA